MLLNTMPMLAGELVEEREVRGLELLERGEAEHGADLALEDDGEDHDAARQRLEHRGADRHGVLGHAVHEDAALVQRALADEALAQRQLRRVGALRGVAVARQHVQPRHLVAAHLVDHALVGVHERHQLREQHASHRGQVALALEHAGHAREVRLQPVLGLVLVRGQPQVADHRVDVVLQLRDLAARPDLDRAREVALRHGRGHLGDGAHLGREVGGEQVDVAGEVLPRPGGAGHVRLAAEAAFHADLARDRGHLVGERGQRAGHVVDGLGERRHLALGVHREALAQVAVRHGRHHLDDAAHLLGEVRRHHVHGVGEVLPRAGHTLHLRLAAQLALGAHLARHARHLGGERVQLVDHGVDRVLELEDLALHVHGDLARQVAAGHGRGHLGDVAHLRGEVRGEQVDVLRQVLPRAAHARDHGLPAQAAVGAHLARHTRSPRRRTSAAAPPWC
jgi:hypothetical protein